MVFTRNVSKLLGSSLANRVFSRPRLVAMLVFLVLLIALQGSALGVAEASSDAASEVAADASDNDMGYVGP